MSHAEQKPRLCIQASSDFRPKDDEAPEEEENEAPLSDRRRIRTGKVTFKQSGVVCHTVI